MRVFKTHEEILPIFIQDFMSSFINTHNNDKTISTEMEVHILISFFKCIEDYIEDNNKDISDYFEIESAQDCRNERKRIQDLIHVLDELIKNINIEERIRACEDRDGY